VLTPCLVFDCAYPQMVTAFSPSGACLTESREPANSRFVRLHAIRSFVYFSSFFFDDDDDGWLSCLNYVSLSTGMAVSAFC